MRAVGSGKLQGLLSLFITGLIKTKCVAKPVCKRASGGFDVHVILQRHFYPAGFAGDITLKRLMTFADLPLHDAVRAAIHISWEADRCDLRVLPIRTPSHLLVFEGFTALEFPKQGPLGPSSCINAVREPHRGCFEIELQSGDVLRIQAPHWSYRPEASE